MTEDQLATYRRRRNEWSLIDGICTFFVYLPVAGLILHIGLSLALGGSASEGMVRNGTYFVGSKGDYTEVTPAQWQASLILTRCWFGSLPAAVAAYLIRGVIRLAYYGESRGTGASRRFDQS